ncbi:MAG: hypothetical protein HC806_04410 [Anaerolineae bacterium]|nr:hypothetical protein [Anaerolineae bacterium]
MSTDVSLIIGDYRNSPRVMLYRLIVETFKDYLETIIGAWGIPFFRLLGEASYSELQAITFISFIVFGLLFLYFLTFRKSSWSSQETDNRWSQQFMLIGALTVLFTLIPLIAAGRDVRFTSQFDRYTLQTTIGVGLLIVGFLSYALQPKLRLIIFLALVSVSVTTHYLNGVYYRTLWDYQQQLWWQLSWRAPAIERILCLSQFFQKATDLLRVMRFGDQPTSFMRIMQAIQPYLDKF